MRRLGSLAVIVLVLAACDDDDDDMDAGRDAAAMIDAGPVDAALRDGGDRPTDGGTDGGEEDDDAGPQPDAGAVGGGAATSAQIQAVRDATGGPTDLPIDDVVVAYVKDAIGDDPAGFFLQAERMGPAIFVRVDPATLTPPAEAGQVVDLRVTDSTTEQGRREVVSIADWSVDSSDNDVAFLVQNVSAIDLPTMLDEYEAELVTATFEVRGLFRDAGAGFERASVDTAGVPDSALMTLRIPTTLADTFVFEPGCRYTATATPLWRLNTEVQLSAFEASELSRADCDTPVMTGAIALNERAVVVRFSRTIDPATVMASGAQFTVTNSASAAVPVTSAMAFAGQRFVIVETGADMATDAFFTIAAANTVLDTAGTGVDPTMNSDIFEGYSPHLVVNEIDYDQPGADAAELIEIHNPGRSAISLAGLSVFTVTGAAGTMMGATVPLVPNSASVTELPAGGYLLVLTASSSGVTVPTGVPTVTLTGSLDDGPAGVVVRETTGGPAGCHDAAFYEGIPTAAAFMGCSWEANAGTDPGVGSLSRIPNGADSHENGIDFRVTPTPTPGAANTP